MTPLRITATLAGGMHSKANMVHLDALLIAAECIRRGMPPPSITGIDYSIKPPLERSACGRYWLSSCAVLSYDAYEQRWQNRRFPIKEAQGQGSSKLKRVLITGGLSKSFRIPMQFGHVCDDTLRWYCMGDKAAIEELLTFVTSLGGRRGVGCGRVKRWTVEPMAEGDIWPGFPVVYQGRPLRPLPIDSLLVTEGDIGYLPLDPPRWPSESHRAEQVFLPQFVEGLP